MRRPELTIEQILDWADAYFERTGNWPQAKSGRVWEPPDEKWQNIDLALRIGLRGLNRGQSLARLLAKHRGKRNRKQLPAYTLKQILAWADAFHARNGRWPRSEDGAIVDVAGESWYAVDMALRNGLRGMPGGSSLPRLLNAKRGVPNPKARPRLTTTQILIWADAHRNRTGNWPLACNEPVKESPDDTWLGINKALRSGLRGLRRGGSLMKLLARNRGVSRHVRRPPLTESQILAWADAYNARTRDWPDVKCGAIPEAHGETWLKVDSALRKGTRGLAGGTTLANFLSRRRGVRNHLALPLLTEEQILNWARAYKRQHGRWPSRDSGPIAGSNGETWSGVRGALYYAGRGLKRRTTLTRLIQAHS